MKAIVAIMRRLAEVERRQANAIRFGAIAEVNLANATVRVAIGNLRTAWLPWLAQHAGDNARAWSAPAVGEQVVVLSPSGELAAGVVLPAIYCANAAAPAAEAHIHTIHYPDGATITYDHKEHRLSAIIPGSAMLKTTGPVSIDTGDAADIKAATAITLTAPAITLNGTTLINGALFQGTGSAGGAATMKGPLAVTEDVTAGPISLKTHTHGNVESGPSRTSGPS